MKLYLWLGIILIIYFCFNNKEHYENSTKSKGWTGGSQTTDNQPLDEDTIFYLHESDSFKTSGLAKCQQECYGPCVPYGLTGSAWCYPVDKN